MKKFKVRKSGVHGRGVFCTEKISREETVMEYLGEKVSIKEGDRRAEVQMKKASKGKVGAVFLFELNTRYYLDGNIPGNPAKYINHSCDPNCRFENDRGHIYVISQKSLKPEDELTVDYGFDAEIYEDHPCRCGSENCVGYIVQRRQWRKLKSLIEKAKVKAKAEA
ncbi:MAG: SET domain-containing protein [Planctomycetes bacterium]|nr:SET domain-containing protein [Planctomycetota bacterium]